MESSDEDDYISEDDEDDDGAMPGRELGEAFDAGETQAFGAMRRAQKAAAEARVKAREAADDADFDGDDGSPETPACDGGEAAGGVFHLTGREPLLLQETCTLADAAREKPPTPKIAKRVSKKAVAPPEAKAPPRPETSDEKHDGPKVMRLLGDLPTLDGKAKKASRAQLKAFMNLDLEVPEARLQVMKGDKLQTAQMGYVASKDGRGPLSPTSGKTMEEGGVPKRLCCAINGHLMRDPVKAKGRSAVDTITFERETIELWLETRGSVCPITGKALVKGDLIPDVKLRNDIVRYQIQKTMAAEGPMDPFDELQQADGDAPPRPAPVAEEDDADLYDF